MNPTRRTPIFRATLLTAATLSPNALATTATWTSLTSGIWTNPANWSTNPTYPSNGSPDPSSTYDVTLLRPAAATANPTITLSSDITLDSLTINPSSILLQTSGTLRPGTMTVSGSYSLTGGTLLGGTLTKAGAGFNVGNATIDGTTLLANLGVSPGGSLALLNPQPFDHTLSVGNSSSFTPASLTVAGSLTGAGQVTFNSSSTSTGSTLLFTHTPTVGPGFTLRSDAGNAAVSSSVGPITNFGTFSAQAERRTLSVTSPLVNQSHLQALNRGTLTLPSVTNNGTISASGNSTLNLAGVNNGSITLTDSALHIVGPFTGNPATLVNSTVDIAGTLTTPQVDALPIPSPIRIVDGGTIDNAASTLVVSAARTFILDQGRITGGTITSPDQTPITVADNDYPNARISSAVLSAPLVLEPRASVDLVDVTLNAPVILSRDSAAYPTPFPDNFDHYVFNGGSVALPYGARPADILADRTLPPDARVRYSNYSLDNTGQTLVLPCTTALYETTIKGGTIAGPGRLTMDRSVVQLNGVTLATDLDVEGFPIIFRNSLTLANSTVTFTNSGPETFTWLITYGDTKPFTFSGTGTLAFDGDPSTTTNVLSAVTLTFSPGITITTRGAPAHFRDATNLLGTAEARNGHTLSFPSLTNLVNNTLTGGTFAAYDSTLSLGPGAITTNNATLLLSGPSASIVGPGGTLPIARNYGSLTLTDGKKLTLSNLTSTGSITVGPDASLQVNGTLTNTGTLTLAGGTLVINYPAAGPSPIDTFRQQLLSSLIRAADGTPSHLRPAYAEASAIPESRRAAVALRTVDTTSLILTLAPTGDANLDGLVNADDYALLDRSLATNLLSAHWTDGDFNYDGLISSADYLLLDTTYAQTQTLTPAFLSQRQSQFGPDYVAALLTSIPEPALALSSILYPLSALLKRRQRR